MHIVSWRSRPGGRPDVLSAIVAASSVSGWQMKLRNKMKLMKQAVGIVEKRSENGRWGKLLHSHLEEERGGERRERGAAKGRESKAVAISPQPYEFIPFCEPKHTEPKTPV